MPVLPALQNAASPATAGQYVSVDLGKLQVGSKLRTPIWDDCAARDVLLLAAGTTLAASTLELLKARGIRSVRVHRSDLGRLTTPRSSVDRAASALRTPPAPEREPGSHWGHTPRSFANQIVRPGPEAYRRDQAERCAAAFRGSVSTMKGLFAGMSAGDLCAAPELATVASDALNQITQDLDLFVSLGLVPAHDSYCGQHSVQTAMLAMSIGTTLGLDKDELVELSIGCLIHDAGMLRLRGPVLDLPRELSPLEFLEITKHPSITYDLLRNLREVSVGARHVAYQMHERCDGSGYPRRRTAVQIHPLAKIAAVADVFHALVSPRPWRQPTLPYEAIKRIILDARKGLFDTEVVRALLKTVSLFPIGSFVETSDGRVGRVIRANGDQYTRPIVELWAPEEGSAAAQVVNLLEATELSVTRPLAVAPPPAAPLTPAPHAPREADEARAAAALADNWE